MSLENAVKRLESAVSGLESAFGGAASSAAGDVPASVAAYDELYDAEFAPFINAARSLGGDYTKFGDIAETAFKNVRAVILAATKVKKPTDEQLVAGLFAPSAAALGQAGGLIDNKAKTFNHASAFAEYLNSVQWVMITPTPKGFVGECKNSADFYLNKILTTFKDDPLKEHHRNFVKYIKSSLDALADYIKKFHTTGTAWNANGVDLSAYKPDAAAGATAATAASSGGSIEDRLAALANKVEKLTLVAGKRGGAGKGGDSKSDSDDPPSVADYDAVVQGPVKDFIENCKKLGGDYAKLGELSEQGFKKLRLFIVGATKCAKPSDDELGAKFAEIATIIGTVKPDNRNKAFNHQSAFNEHIQILQWVLVAPAPKPFVQGTVEAADFYLNKILTTFKDDPQKAEHRAFVKAIKDITNDLGEYVKKYHTTGLAWKGSAKFADFKL